MKKGLVKIIVFFSIFIFVFSFFSDIALASIPNLEELIENQEFEKALEIVNNKEIRKKYSKDSSFWHFAGIVYNSTNNYLESIESYKKAIDLGEKISYNNLANVYNKIAEFDKALKYYDKYNEIGGDKGYYYSNMANVYFAQEDIGMAIELVKKSIAANDHLGFNRTKLGYYYEIIGEDEKAIEQYDIGANSTSDWQISTRRGYGFMKKSHLLRIQGKLEDAINSTNSAIDLQPNGVSLYIERAKLYHDQKNNSAAKDDLNKALSLAVTEADKSYINVWKYLIDGSKDSYKIATSLNAKHPEDYYTNACIYSLLNEKDNAIRCLKEAIRNKPGYKYDAMIEMDFENIRNSNEFTEAVFLKQYSIVEDSYNTINNSNSTVEIKNNLDELLSSLNQFQKGNSVVLEQLAQLLDSAKRNWISISLKDEIRYTDGKIHLEDNFSTVAEKSSKEAEEFISEILDKYGIKLNRKLVSEIYYQIPDTSSKQDTIEIVVPYDNINELSKDEYIFFQWKGNGVSIKIGDLLDLLANNFKGTKDIDGKDILYKTNNGEEKYIVISFKKVNNGFYLTFMTPDNNEIYKLPFSFYIVLPESYEKVSGSNTIMNTGENIGGIYRIDKGGMEVRNNTTGEYYISQYNKDFEDILLLDYDTKKSIRFLASKGFIDGKSKKSFNPNENMTRAEFVNLMVKALSVENTGNNNNFPDVKKSDWYYNAVVTSAENDLVKGFEDGKFKPNNTITKEQAIAVCARQIANKMNYSVDNEDIGSILAVYKDNSSIPKWCKNEVAIAREARLIDIPANGTFSGKKPLTRAEGSKLIYELYNLLIRQ